MTTPGRRDRQSTHGPVPSQTRAALRRRLGAVGEQLALEHFQRLGFELLDRNYRTRWGELDLIVFDGRTLVFAEVKTSSVRAGVQPFERLDGAKQRQVRSIASAWLRERRDRPYAELLRFDAVGVTVDEAGRLLSLDHLEDAF